MWSKSPLLLATVAVAIFVKERIEKMAKRAEFKLQRLIGLDKHQWKGWYGGGCTVDRWYFVGGF
jgi:hypothetical protein